MSDKGQSREEIQVVIVLPYLNEKDSLSATCRSLGFGIGDTVAPPQSSLILIDNGSTDTSPQVAQNIKENSSPGSVITDFEPEPGHVPPRRRGNLVARRLAEMNGWNESNVLSLQADADVSYPENYIDLMCAATYNEGQNTLLEGFMSYPPDFLELHRGYFELWLQAESSIVHLFATEEEDCLIVDCVTGYRLSDYFSWGEHQREYNQNEDEIHAETSRLYLKAKANGARRFRVEDAMCRHSARKLILDPALHFAAAGFPREEKWNEFWRDNYHGPSMLPDFYTDASHPEVIKSILFFQKHSLALLTILPFHINACLGQDTSLISEKLSSFLRSKLPHRPISDLRTNPGLFISDVFQLSDNEGNELLKLCVFPKD